MTESNNYTDPWNDMERKKPMEFRKHVQYTVEKDVVLTTDAYEQSVDEDEDGIVMDVDTTEIEWEDEYEANCITPIDMFEELSRYVKQDIAMTGSNSGKGAYLKRLLDACEGWKRCNVWVSD